MNWRIEGEEYDYDDIDLICGDLSDDEDEEIEDRWGFEVDDEEDESDNHPEQMQPPVNTPAQPMEPTGEDYPPTTEDHGAQCHEMKRRRAKTSTKLQKIPMCVSAHTTTSSADAGRRETHSAGWHGFVDPTEIALWQTTQDCQGNTATTMLAPLNMTPTMRRKNQVVIKKKCTLMD